MKLAEGFNKDTPEYKEAAKMEAAGTLFEKFTSKKYADLAESVLAGTFSDLLAEEEGIDIEADHDEEEEEEFGESCYVGLFETLELQGKAHQKAHEMSTAWYK